MLHIEKKPCCASRSTYTGFCVSGAPVNGEVGTVGAEDGFEVSGETVLGEEVT
jgi:hypothetical protein